MAEAADSGDYDLPRREGSDHITPVDGVIATIMTRLDSVRRDADGRLVNATDPWFLTEAEIAGRRQALEYVRFLVDRVPGYEHASLVALGTQIGVRETRRVYGDYRLTRDDVLGAAPVRRRDRPVRRARSRTTTAGRTRSGSTCPTGRRSASRTGSLVVRDAANVLVAGRCFSATHDAHASVRSMAQCMAMGQAAGTAAAMAVAAGRDPRDLDVAALRDRLRADGAILDARRRARRRWPRDVRPDRPRRHRARGARRHLRHEHLVIDGGRPVQLEPEFDLADVEAMATEVAAAAALGLRSVVDAMPCDAGRNAAKLAETCRGGPASTSSRPPGCTTTATTARRTGATASRSRSWRTCSSPTSPTASTPTTTRGPVVRRTDAPGRASSRSRAPRTACRRATGGCSRRRPQAHRRTGAPILTHCEHGTGALEQIRFLGDHGVSPEPHRAEPRRQGRRSRLPPRARSRPARSPSTTTRSAGRDGEPNGTVQLHPLDGRGWARRPDRARHGCRTAPLLPGPRWHARA